MYRAIASTHVVTVMGILDAPDNGICIIMEYMEFGSLKHFTPLHLISSCGGSACRHHGQGGGMWQGGEGGVWHSDCWAMRMRMIYEMTLGMNYLHTLDPPILHRDLKLENVFVAQGFVIKVL